MNEHNDKHYKRKWQMCHMPVFEKVLHGLQPVNPAVKRNFIFYQT
jgi:hypothetical protein